MIRKVYRLKLYPQTTYAVQLKDKNIVQVRFTGATFSNSKQNGAAIVDDPDIQKALEESKQFGKLYILESETEIKEAEQAIIPPTSVEATIPPVIPPAPPVDPLDINSITKFTDAKEYLRVVHNIATGELTNTTKLLEKAKELGVEFPNWNIS